jgi:hypothetical protein
VTRHLLAWLLARVPVWLVTDAQRYDRWLVNITHPDIPTTYRFAYYDRYRSTGIYARRPLHLLVRFAWWAEQRRARRLGRKMAPGFIDSLDASDTTAWHPRRPRRRSWLAQKWLVFRLGRQVGHDL